HGKIPTITLTRQPVAGFAIFQLGLNAVGGISGRAPLMRATCRKDGRAADRQATRENKSHPDGGGEPAMAKGETETTAITSHRAPSNSLTTIVRATGTASESACGGNL